MSIYNIDKEMQSASRKVVGAGTKALKSGGHRIAKQIRTNDTKSRGIVKSW